MKRICTLSVLTALSSPVALAAGFEAKTMRSTMPSREVERGLIIGRGWLEFGLGMDHDYRRAKCRMRECITP